MLELKDIYYSVPQKDILDGISLTLDPGEELTIAGASGAGKSTILKLAANLISPTKGTINFDGKDISTLVASEYRKEISYCFQQPVLFGDVVEDNFKFVYKIHNQSYDEKRVADVMDSLELPQAMLNQKIDDLSGGEKQRVALGRNVAILPKALLLDEVTAGLDTTTKQVILKWLEHMNADNKVALLRVTHEQDEISSAKNIKFVVNGKLVDHE